MPNHKEAQIATRRTPLRSPMWDGFKLLMRSAIIPLVLVLVSSAPGLAQDADSYTEDPVSGPPEYGDQLASLALRLDAVEKTAKVVSLGHGLDADLARALHLAAVTRLGDLGALSFGLSLMQFTDQEGNEAAWFFFHSVANGTADSFASTVALFRGRESLARTQIMKDSLEEFIAIGDEIASILGYAPMYDWAAPE